MATLRAPGVVVGTVAGAPLTPPPAAASGRTALQVTAVDRAQKGLAVGEVILLVDGKWVASQADLTGALKQNQRESQVVVYNPDSSKADTRKLAVLNGSLGVDVQTVQIDLQD